MKNFIILLLCLSASFMGHTQCNNGCIIGNLTIPVGQTATFTSPIAQCTSCYDWDINSNATSSDNQTVGTVKIVGTDMGQTVQLQGVTAGAFSLQLTYFDETGCHTCCLNGNVITPPACNYTLSCPTVVSSSIANQTVTFKANTNPVLTGATYNWIVTYQNNITATYTGTTNLATFPASLLNQIVSITVTVSLPNCPTKSITCSGSYFPVTPLPNVTCLSYDPANLAFSQGQPLNINEGVLNYAYLGNPYSAPIPSVGLTFTWHFRLLNGILLTFNGQNPTFRQICPYDQNSPVYGTYPNSSPVMAFCVIISNGVQTKTLSANSSMAFPLPVSGSSTTCFFHESCFPLGAPSSSSSKITVSPNPTSSIINFNGENLELYKVSIFDDNGNEVVRNAALDGEINIEGKKRGLYFYRITDEKGLIQEGKLIKE